ncbi:hypothetical protein AOQ84DRAFT_369819 [Glonium stellatum]|uniref:Uncharacterized protein n=1 Tax=Glonium stellatum TaxID=574774 RepID=A0A8E2ENM5_9PEZI|nr:hypothetical protein AOQ84DRAFT_369819 [Glonium stellatum]
MPAQDQSSRSQLKAKTAFLSAALHIQTSIIYDEASHSISALPVYCVCRTREHSTVTSETGFPLDDSGSTFETREAMSYFQRLAFVISFYKGVAGAGWSPFMFLMATSDKLLLITVNYH